MAVLTSTACQTLNGMFLYPPKVDITGVIARTALYTKAAAESAGDVIQMVPVPKGATVLDIQVAFNLGGGAFTANIGDGNSTGRFAASLSTNIAAVQRMTSVAANYQYSADDTIDILVGTATSASAVGSIRLTAYYTMD